jgi:hypothetical protein
VNNYRIFLESMPWIFIGFRQQIDDGTAEGFGNAPQVPYGHVVADTPLDLANLGLRHSGLIRQLYLGQAGLPSSSFKKIANVHFLSAKLENPHILPALLRKKNQE